MWEFIFKSKIQIWENKNEKTMLPLHILENRNVDLVLSVDFTYIFFNK